MQTYYFCRLSRLTWVAWTYIAACFSQLYDKEYCTSLNSFPQVLLISGCANMWVQFEGGNKQGQVQLVSQYLRAHMHTAPLAALAE